MRRMQRGLMAAHESELIAQNNLATEGVGGFLLGFLTGTLSTMVGFGGVHGAVLKNQVLKKREEIQALAEEMAKVAADNGKAAVKDGKLDAETYKKEIDVGFDGVIGGFFGGAFFGPWYTAVRTSQLEDLRKNTQKKIKELQELLDKAKKDEGQALESFLCLEGEQILSPQDELALESGELALEGWRGGLKGFVIGLGASILPFGASAAGISYKRKVLKLREEIQGIAKQIAEVAADNGKKAVEEGKLKAEDFKKEVDIGWKGVVGGFFGGGFFGPWYSMVRGSQIEDLKKEMDSKVKELQAMLDKASETKEAMESLVDHSDTAETGLIQIAAMEAEAIAIESDMDQAADVALALEQMSTAMRTAGENGGLSRDGARVAHVAADSLCKSIGLRSAMKSMPSLESYGSVSSRVVATNLALEDLAEKAKLIWAKIVEAIKKSIAWIKERFALMFSVAGKLKSRAEAVAKAAGSVEGEAEEAEIDNARLFSALAIDGKVDGLIAGMEWVAGHAAEVYSGAEHRMAALLAATEAKTQEDLFKALSGLGSMTPQGGTLSTAEGKTVWTSPTLPGGKALVITLPSEDSLSGEMVDIARVLVGSSAAVTSVGEAGEGKLAALSPADAGKLATVCAKAAAAVFQFEQALRKVSDEKAKAAANAEAMGKVEGDSDEAKNSRAMGSVFQAMGKLVDNPVAGYSAYILNTVKAALDYAAASIKRPGMVAKAADAVGEAAEKTGEAVKAGAEKVGETAGKVGEAVKAGAAKVADKVAPKKPEGGEKPAAA